MIKWLKNFGWILVALISGIFYATIKAIRQNKNGKIRNTLDKINIEAEKRLNKINEEKKDVKNIKDMSDSELDNKLHNILNGL